MPGIKQHSHRNALGSTFSGLQRNVIRIKCELDYVSVLCPLRVLKIQNNLIYYEPESALDAALGEIRHSWFHALPMQWARLCSHTGIMIQISSIDRMSIVPAVWKEFLLKHFFEWCGSYPSELKRLQLNSIWKISESFKRLCYGNREQKWSNCQLQNVSTLTIVRSVELIESLVLSISHQVCTPIRYDFVLGQHQSRMRSCGVRCS